MRKLSKIFDFEGFLMLLSLIILTIAFLLHLFGWGEGPGKHELEMQESYEDSYCDGLSDPDLYMDAYNEGYYDGYEDGVDMGQDEGYRDGYHEGSQFGWQDHIHEVADYFAGGAVDFAIEYGGMHPEDAASIIENGGSESEYEAAAKTLYYYFMYFFNCEYS